jgi:hypothetical protein
MAWRFDKTDDDVQIADDVALTLPDGDWTIAGWLKLDAHDYTKHQYFFSWGDYAATPSFNWWFTATTKLLQAYVVDDDGTAINGVVGAGTYAENTTWQHVLIQRSGNTVTQYINGVADGADTDAAFNGVNVDGNLYFGSRSDENPDRRFGGNLAEWGCWGRALSAAERAMLVAGASPVCIAKKLAWCAPMLRTYEEVVVPLTVINDGSVIAEHPPTAYSCDSEATQLAVANYGRLTVYTLSWTSGWGGAVEYRFDGLAGRPLLRGILHRVETAPSELLRPLNNWDLVVENKWGTDILGGLGADRSYSVAQAVFPRFLPGTSGHGERGIDGPVTLKITNAGGRRSGVVALYALSPQGGEYAT